MREEPRTPDLVEAFRPSLEAIDRRDWDAAMAVYGPDAVWDMSPQGMGVFEGRDAVRGLIEDWWGVYEDSEQRVEELRDLGNGVAFVVAVTRGRLPGSVGFVELRFAVVATWADRLIQRITSYTDIEEARAAAERLAQEPA
jgi:ketosteroid isomerase-like protein